MIESYKIITGKYYAGVAPTLPKGSTSIARGNDLKFRNLMSSMICINLVLQTGWLIHGFNAIRLLDSFVKEEEE